MSKINILEDDSFETAITSSDTVLVDFGASWCAPCKALEPILEKLAQEVDYPIFKIDIDDAPEVTKKFGIISVPTVICFKQGKIHKKSLGLVAKEKILDLFKD